LNRCRQAIVAPPVVSALRRAPLPMPPVSHADGVHLRTENYAEHTQRNAHRPRRRPSALLQAPPWSWPHPKTQPLSECPSKSECPQIMNAPKSYQQRPHLATGSAPSHWCWALRRQRLTRVRSSFERSTPNWGSLQVQVGCAPRPRKIDRLSDLQSQGTHSHIQRPPATTPSPTPTSTDHLQQPPLPPAQRTGALDQVVLAEPLVPH
jgi:hypothetical protein